ncbi:MAG TPA: phosphopantetheine-binding protein [Xanthobacteraceae bacterium]|jgi:acyl carrier protein|nr:phosphopantetheine-binding protein [Xanthobacteraceae bacterium]
MVDVANGVIELVAGKVRNKQDPLQMSDLLESLGLESLDVLELTFAIEEKFNIEIPFNANTEFNFKTVGDLVHAVEGLVAKKTASA